MKGPARQWHHVAANPKIRLAELHKHEKVCGEGGGEEKEPEKLDSKIFLFDRDSDIQDEKTHSSIDTA